MRGSYRSPCLPAPCTPSPTPPAVISLLCRLSHPVLLSLQRQLITEATVCPGVCSRRWTFRGLAVGQGHNRMYPPRRGRTQYPHSRKNPLFILTEPWQHRSFAVSLVLPCPDAIPLESCSPWPFQGGCSLLVIRVQGSSASLRGLTAHFLFFPSLTEL